MPIQWSLKTFKIKDLKDFHKNPRRLTEDQYKHLKISLDKFGLIDKPIVTQEGMLIGGHQRVKVFKKDKVKEVECWVPDQELQVKDIEELNIRLNKNQGEWDFEILANQWELDDLMDWGFSAEELAIEASDLGHSHEEEDTEILELGKDENAITKIGDNIFLDNHRLVCGDSTLSDVYSNLCPDNENIILMVTDPPYGVEYDPCWRIGKGGKAGDHIKASGKVSNDCKANWELAWNLFPGSIAYVWHADKYCSEVQKSLEEAKFQIICQIIWVKQNFTLSRGDYHWKHEPCWYAVKKGKPHNWQGARDQSTIWEIASFSAFGKSKEEDERTAHSTQKPIECMARPIRNNTKEGDAVYDPFLGSGTTLIACEQLNRICYGIELSPAYCDIIVKRWIKYRTKLGKDAIVKRNGTITEDYN